MTKVTGFRTIDIRFPTSRNLDGSDAMNKDPDYSAAYLILETDDVKLSGHSFVFTCGRGNDLQCRFIEQVADYAVGLDIKTLANSMGEFARNLVRDTQIRWLGPEKGVTHMAVGAVVNAAWDLISKAAGKPLWEYLVDLSPEEIVELVDFRYISDFLSKSEALDILKKAELNKEINKARLISEGLPAYTTTPGWLGYSDEKMIHLSKKAVSDGFKLIKLKCGENVENDKRRLKLVREAVGPDIKIAIDANQVWDVDQAISWLDQLQDFDLHWIEEPTSPDDIIGHAKIAQAIAPIKVATGEMVQNRIIFKQMLQMKSLSFLQIDATRVAGINENIAHILMAAKVGVPVCPHSGGVGLCELVQHLPMFDFIAVSGDHPDRVVEFVDHLHEHFVNPTRIKNGRYMVPTQPGSSAEILPESAANFSYPTGKEWMGYV